MVKNPVIDATDEEEKSEAKSDPLHEIRERFKLADEYWSDERQAALDDIKFRAGEQWPAEIVAQREKDKRPCLTVDKLNQYVRQIVNDGRQNRPSIKVSPVDSKADIATAEVLAGIVKHIESRSNADAAYDTALDSAATGGFGYFTVTTEYAGDETFDQNICIKRVRNPLSIIIDPESTEADGSDMKFAFVMETMTKEAFEAKYPNKLPADFDSNEKYEGWYGDEVRIARYWEVVEEDRTLYQMVDGTVISKARYDELKEGGMIEIDSMVKATRNIPVRKVMHSLMSGADYLEEPQEWPGKYIPVIRVVGNEFEIDGKIYISGLVRNAKDAQRMYNYWVSQEAEMLALAPKAPFIGYGGQFEGYEQQWKTANINNWPYLEVNPDVTDGQGGPLPLPARSQPPMASSGLLQAKAGASDDIKASTGQYDSSLGATSNERSGKAILAREKQSDTGTYHYVDNLARAIRYSTRQLVDLIPKIYDTQRIARIIGIDGETDQAAIDPMQPMPVKKIQNEQGIVIKKIYNPGVGKYDVAVTTGPSYMTKRQESLDAMSLLLQGNPNLWAVAGDLFIKNMDWPGAQEMSQRFAKTIDPKLLSDADDPALQAAQQQMEAMGKEMDQMHMMLQNVSKSMEAQDLQVKQFDSQVKAYDAETKRISAVQAGMSEEQIQDIVMGTVHGMITSGDLVNEMPGRDQDMPGMPEMPQEGMEQQGVPQ